MLPKPRAIVHKVDSLIYLHMKFLICGWYEHFGQAI